jgi:integrating conjugative element protein (TIGR03757 family)
MKWLIVFFLLVSSFAHASEPRKMIVVVNDEQKKSLSGVKSVERYFNRINSDFSIYSIDDVDNFEDSFSEGLSSDQEEAKQQVKDKYESIGKEKMSRLIIKAYKAKMLTLQYRLEKYPAIVFDDKYVVYGEFNLNTALNKYIKVKG